MTILELLVSLSLVVLFAALALPASLSALNTLDFVRCVSLRNELGEKTIIFSNEFFGENPPADAVVPYHADHLLTALAPYGISNHHFVCPAFERKHPGLAGEFHFIPTGVPARALKQVDAATYTLYFEIFDIHGNGRVEVMGDGRARFQPGSTLGF